jgi:transcriptional regulator with XRE-family HTH domain
MEFYKVLQEIMITRDLSIPEIARLSGLSDGTLRSAIVRKQKNVALDVAFKLSRGLGVSLEYLNTGVQSTPAEQSPAGSLALAPAEIAFLEKYRALTPDSQSRVDNCLSFEYKQLGDEVKEANSISAKIG